MVIKTNKCGALCEECHKFGVEKNGMCYFCGHNKFEWKMPRTIPRYTIKYAVKHLDPCEQTNCKFARTLVKEINGSMDIPVCCFGLRHEGCVYCNPEMQHQIGLHSQVEIDLTIAKYEADPWWAARTRNEKVDFPSMPNLIEPARENIAKITGKVYNFIYEGHEYTHQDNSLDFKSCPHCDSGNKTRIGYYSEGRNRIVCFECQKCFEKFYYHDPE